ncbi:MULTISPECIES: type II secretion system protein GspG [unclassified Cellulophaga]|uniref:type II secretion system protein GspG n=1 Tax=unclassified Cellulophaga TaxID=2634405 RepID=UPI0026E204B7|nr:MULTISPECIES: type II secretion system protein GspG [unclassified Cellulophaga]MDO6492886.1 type II secretion system protein GspG [Cellulophaga sp. 2_MG-2023]MDO6496388.1 type II secretion system protein GspG [Cellulophaga sp. 3_MG-2023]
MTKLILSILAEFGLIREDFKHHRKTSKMEKADGKKRPFQRYFLQPSSIMVISALVIGNLSAILFFTYQGKFVFPEKTKQEISEMSARMDNWKENLGKYPTELNELIGNSPLRQEWKKDAWNREYEFKIIGNGKGYLITSAGSDGKFGNEDDIKSVK